MVAAAILTPIINLNTLILDTPATRSIVPVLPQSGAFTLLGHVDPLLCIENCSVFSCVHAVVVDHNFYLFFRMHYVFDSDLCVHRSPRAVIATD